MAQPLVYCSHTGGARKFAADHLQANGIPVVAHPTPEVTHLLLDVPTKQIPEGLLERLPENTTVIGGNLDIPELAGYQKLDLLQDENYLAFNAAITADCALWVARQRMETTFHDTPTLIIGWGRIGKCLSQLLKNLGCPVTVAARKSTDRSMLQAMGFRAADPSHLTELNPYRLIFNTAPVPVLSRDALHSCPNCIKVDLASQPGLDAEDVIWARGLPGVYAPESSGALIAEIFLKRYKEGYA